MNRAFVSSGQMGLWICEQPTLSSKVPRSAQFLVNRAWGESAVQDCQRHRPQHRRNAPPVLCRRIASDKLGHGSHCARICKRGGPLLQMGATVKLTDIGVFFTFQASNRKQKPLSKSTDISVFSPTTPTSLMSFFKRFTKRHDRVPQQDLQGHASELPAGSMSQAPQHPTSHHG